MAIRQTSVSASTSNSPSASHACASTSSSTSITPLSSRNYSYDVLISLDRQDVKESFSKHLYSRLLSHGFRVFMGEEELDEGMELTPQIKEAIETASVHVPIFSPGYAGSKHRLDELVMMWKSGGTILPVFYDVYPDELECLRGEGGVYAQALHNLEKESTYDSKSQEDKVLYEPSTIENWRVALSRVVELRGFELEACDG